MILSNVELFWAKLDPSNPDNGFSGDKPQWNTQLRTRCKDQCKEWKEIGLNVITDDDDDGTTGHTPSPISVDEGLQGHADAGSTRPIVGCGSGFRVRLLGVHG